MKKLTLKNLIISLSVLLCFLSVGVFTALANVEHSGQAYADAPEPTNEIVWKEADGGVPYALYGLYNAQYTNYESGDYVLLSTDASDIALNSTTLYVRFNRQKTALELGNEATVSTASLNINATLNGNPITVSKNEANTQDAFVEYRISLRDSYPMYWNDGNLTPIEIEDRVGEYEFTFTYRYTQNGVISDTESVVYMSFTLINKYDYFKDASSYAIKYADRVQDATLENRKVEAYAYNFNKYNASGELVFPVITYNANIFALNYTYTLGNTSYKYIYRNFTPIMSASEAESKAIGTHTGNVIFEQEGSGQTFSVPTRKIEDADGNSVPYNAEIMLNSFGDYQFGVDLLVSTASGYIITEVAGLADTTVKFLTIFGYEITYKDQATNTYKKFANEITHADIAGSHTISLDDDSDPATPNTITNVTQGFIPELHPTTDQAPVRFNYNVTELNDKKGHFKIFTTLEDAMNEIHTSFMDYDDTDGKYYFKLNIKDAVFTTSATNPTLDYIQTSKFDKDGVYVVKLDYNVVTSYGNRYYGSQLFLFEINNTAPITIFQTIDQDGNIEEMSSIYTNKNIRVLVKNNANAFNAPVSLAYTRYSNYDDNITQLDVPLIQKTEASGTPVIVEIDGEQYFNYVWDNTKNFALPYTENGRYIISITYSPSRLKSRYEYFVDSSPITNINIYNTQVVNGEYILDTTIKTVDQIADLSSPFGYDMSLTGKSFSINWAEKKWASRTKDGITTTVDSYYIPINNTNDTVEAVEVTNADDSISHLLTNGYSTGDLSEITYTNSFNASPLNETQYLTANGIYLFHVKDFAGNEFYRMIMLDSTQSRFIQESYNESTNTWANSFDPINNQPNFVKTHTRVTFGEYKAINARFLTQTYPADSTAEQFVNFFKATSYEAISDDDTRGFVIIPITTINYTIENTDTGAKTNGTLDPKDYWLINLYPNSVQGTLFAGEQRYNFTAVAKNGTERKLRVEMNFDNASGQYWASGEDNGDNTSHYITTNSGTNLHVLSFKYKDAEEDGMYKIAKISYKYYAFNYDAGSTTYPFSSNPTDQNNFTLPTVKGADDYYHINNINLEEGKTRAGKYTLTRTYVGGGYDKDGNNAQGYGEYDAEGNKVSFGNDRFERSYTVYIDHNGIISTTYQAGNVRAVGEHISITLGNGTNNKYEFKNFFRSVSSGTPILTTNKLPVQINIPIYKYFVDEGSAIDNVMCRLSFNELEVVITYQNTAVAFSPVVTYRITEFTKEGYFVIPEFTAEGRYTITINDHTGYSDLESGLDNINPMKYSCAFVIEHTAPEGHVYVNNEPMAKSTVQENSFATNVSPDTGVVDFVWDDAVDPYTASVVEINITANDKTETIDFTQLNVDKIAQGEEEIDLTEYTFIKAVSIVILSTDEFEFKTYTQHSYKVTLNIDEEIDYIIEIRYAPTAVKDHGYGDFVSTSYRVKIDRTKPNINIDTLIDTDTYLVSSSYYSSKDDVKENFKEEKAIYSTTTPTIYDYAFTVDASSYILSYDGEDTIPEFYFRKYRKYEDQHQALTPDHPSYSSLESFSNFPRFDYVSNSQGWYEAKYQVGMTLEQIIRQTTGMSNVSKMEGFYEIIERDLAGNYRAFTVYFIDRSQLYNILNIQAKDQSGNAMLTNTQEITQLGLVAVDSVTSEVGWGSLVISDLTTTTKNPITITITPYITYNENYINSNKINDYIVADMNSRFQFNLRSSAGNTSKFINLVKFEQKLEPPTIVKNSDGTYYLQFPVKQADSVIYLTNLQITDSQGKIIQEESGYNNMPTKSENLPEGVYFVTYQDNFNSAPYSYTMQLGIEYVSKEEQYIYYNDKYFEATNGTIYTGGDIRLTYQSKVHSVTISANGGNQITAGTDTYPDVYQGSTEGFKTVILKQPNIVTGTPSNVDIGGEITYVVYYNDISSGSVLSKQTFVIYNKLPAINLYDNNNASISGSTSGGSMALTSSAVKINWADIEDAPHSAIYSSRVSLHTLDASGQTINTIDIDNNRVVTKPGYYMVEICNTVLGNYRTVSFAIQDGDIPFYTVYDSKTNETLLPSSVKLDILNNTDVGTGRSIFEQIKNVINSTVTDSTLKTTLLAKLSEAPTQIEQYFSLNETHLQKDASSELHEFVVTFENGTYTKSILSKNSYVTTFYLIYGINNPIYSNLICITKVPETNNILTSLRYKRIDGTEDALENKTDSMLTNQDVTNSSVTLTWNSVSSNRSEWYTSGNLIYLNYNYNSNNSFKNYGTMSAGKSSITISGTGKHILTFKDNAGNTAVFTSRGTVAASYSYHTLTILDKIIYNVNNSTPLDYMTFNGSVTLSIDRQFADKYDSKSIYATVYRNGTAYDRYVTGEGGYDFTFTESGRYQVTLHAKYHSNINLANNNADLSPATYNFTIIEQTSARLAYEFNEMLGYEIVKIYKDNKDITQQVKEYYIKKSAANVIITADMLENYALRELFVTSDIFGNGSYQITVAVTYNELLAAKEYTFAFKINNATPIILSDPEYGKTTKGTITLTYNPSLIYQQVGKSYLKIYTFNKDTNGFVLYAKYDIDSDALASSATRTATLTETHDYYVQIETDSGNVITSFRVNRAEPLNAMSIIVIVIVSVVVVVAIILFIKLRTKMRVK